MTQSGLVQPRILLAGGGDERDSRPLDEIFAGWLGKGRLLYLPTALVHPSNKEAGVRWMRNTFGALGVTAIDAWMELSGKTARDMAGYDGLYIGGGNTFFLLQQIRAHGLDRAIEAFSREGKPVYGGSAGAILMGTNITSCAHIDENNVGLTDFSGLDLAKGHTIWCHYQPVDEERIRDYVKRTGIASIALTEKAGVYRLGEHLYAAGSEAVVRYTLKDRTEFEAGERVE